MPIVHLGRRTGKTWAFFLPIIERIQISHRIYSGRFARYLVLEATRELDRQMTSDFLSIKTHSLVVTTLYERKRYSSKENSLKKGSDIIVGTSGKIKDFQKKHSFMNHYWCLRTWFRYSKSWFCYSNFTTRGLINYFDAWRRFE